MTIEDRGVEASDGESELRFEEGMGELQQLLAALQPKLEPQRYVFVCVGTDLPSQLGGADTDAALNPIAAIREDEGWTLIVEQHEADLVAGIARGVETAEVFRKITLQVHSELLSVGLTACVATALAKRGISVNVVAAYHHDHLFVPDDRAEESVDILSELMRDAQSRAR